ncbi:MAG: hypothetical protein IKT50_00715 [Clostridia bacterium]|nr:hypothetical protein [Clostridia bacterium]
MPKKKTLKIGSYLAEIFPEETKRAYGLFAEEKKNAVTEMFRAFLKGANKKSLSFLEEMGIDIQKLTCVRPVSQPDENGEVLFFAAARFCGVLLQGGEIFPRQSEEVAGLSVIFVNDEAAFQTEALESGSSQGELRFVIPLPFDEEYFSNAE